MRTHNIDVSAPSTSAHVSKVNNTPLIRRRFHRCHASPRTRRLNASAAAADESMNTRLDGLQEWLRSLSPSFDDCGLHLRSLSDDGYGVRAVAYEDIALDGVVVSVPHEAFLTVPLARNCIKCSQFNDELSSFQILVLKLLYEKHIVEASFWWPYLRTLPSTEELSSHPLLWSVNFLPHNSHAGGKLRERILSCENDVSVFETLRIGQTIVGDANWPSLSEVKWATAILTSRAFHLGDSMSTDVGGEYSDSDYERDQRILSTLNDIDDEVWEPGAHADDELECATDSIALVPWADGLNHSSSATQVSILKYNDATETASLQAHTAYKAGDQVFDSYGINLTCTDMLLNYGFVEVTSSTALFIEFRGDVFLDAATKVLRELNASYSISQLPGINAASTILRVDQNVGMGENALCFCEAFFDDVPENSDGTQSMLLSLQVILRMCDDDLVLIDENCVLKSERIIQGVEYGEILVNERAAAYVIVNEYNALRAAKRAVMRQIEQMMQAASSS